MGSVHVIQLGGNGLKNCNYWEKIITYYIRESVLKNIACIDFFEIRLEWGRTQFVGSEFGIFGGFVVRFGRGGSLVFPDLGLG